MDHGTKIKHILKCAYICGISSYYTLLNSKILQIKHKYTIKILKK